MLHIACIPKREVQQRLAVACDGRQFLALFSGGLRRTPSVARMKKRYRLEEIGIGYTGDDSNIFTRGPESFRKTSMPPLSYIVAVPVFSQFVARGGIHRGNQLERVQRLASSVYFFEDNANSFL